MTYYISLEKAAELILIELAVKKLEMGPGLSTCLNKGLWHESQEAVSCFAVLQQAPKQTLSDMRSKQRRATLDLLFLALSDRHPFRRRFWRVEEEIERKLDDVEVAREKMSRKRGSGNVVNVVLDFLRKTYRFCRAKEETILDYLIGPLYWTGD